MAKTVPIASLPLHLEDADAIEAAYGRELDWIVDKLGLGISVLVEAEKQLTTSLYRAIRGRLKSAITPINCLYLAGHVTEEMQSMNLMQRLIAQLQEAVFSTGQEQVLVLPHLDILTTTTRSGLNSETREAAALLYENPDLLFLAFKDPSFDLPKVIENLFPARQSLIGLPREVLPQLVTQSEARKFAVDSFNPFQMFTYVSGLNALRFREILRHLDRRLDFDPANPETSGELLREIRRMTVVGNLEMPKVDLETDIGGYAGVKKRLREDLLDLVDTRDGSEDPAMIRQIEELVPKGMIFHGPPGTGKTFFAKAIATALDATISIVSGPELKSKWVGESEENLRRVFSQARQSAPAVIVFDELDSFASARGTYQGAGVEHSMVNQLLTEMDGFRKEELVFVIGTTNFVESIDPALLRPGRFELAIEIPFPDTDDRLEILTIYQRKFGLELSDELLDLLVRKTAGPASDGSGGRHTGDHLYAIMRALRREQIRTGQGGPVTVEQIERALHRGNRRSPKLEKVEEHTIAVHEAGHAICAWVLPHCPPIKEVTISTGTEDMLGYVEQDMRKNRYVTTRLELLDDICVMLGGRAAERLLLGDISAGAYSDLMRANAVAHSMIAELGMSDTFGLLSLAGQSVDTYVSERLDAEVRTMLDEQQQRALELLGEHRSELNALVQRLLEKKKLGAADMDDLFGGRSFKQEKSPHGNRAGAAHSAEPTSSAPNPQDTRGNTGDV